MPIPILSGERGFTMVELLVCMLILGILAAIMLPAFTDQAAKGQDTEAKLTLKSAATAVVTHEMSTGTFNATVAELELLEPALADALNLTVAGTAFAFELTEESESGTVFSLRRDASGRITRDCSLPGYGLCRPAADAGGNRW